MEAVLFLSVVIIALTQMVKMALPQQVVGWVTIIIALVMGVVASLFANWLGLLPVSPAEGIVAALGAIGITTAFSKGGGGTAGDGPVVN
jgi:hypothetical protein